MFKTLIIFLLFTFSPNIKGTVLLSNEGGSKCAKDAENISAPLVIVFIRARKRTLAVQAVHQNGSIDTSFDPHQFSLDSTFK
jgi:hypothetical protein